MLRMVLVVLFALFADAAAKAQTATPAPTSVDPRFGCDDVKDFPIPDLGQPQNIDNFKKQLVYYRCTSYEQDVAKVLAAAKMWIDMSAPQVSRPAIVLDIDETSLSNWPRIKEDDFAFISIIPDIMLPKTVDGKIANLPDCNFQRQGDVCGDLDWQQKGYAKAIEPTLKLYKAARCIGVSGPCDPIEVFFVTGRREIEYNHELPSVWTLRNLRAAGYSDVQADHILLRGAAPDDGVAKYKASRREEIKGKGFRIIANIGDQLSDLAGGPSDVMNFKVPNPFYFIADR